ncbi:unnamed protein product [Vitrella brassicaformis CCMP3155]|uniref:Uncharacterized protein n=1 Tax=Vitrella brassicaformis (strain CCMP3155) TaxID=1169540 RepID=A0A0G4GLP3_VITBC|nr:unnamed protein product [Vitrella brassicaformis CCMP3155]|eukprot:CEM31000.1 unnamed protein product [Vitrella brassicaformis CCMP3155]
MEADAARARVEAALQSAKPTVEALHQLQTSTRDSLTALLKRLQTAKARERDKTGHEQGSQTEAGTRLSETSGAPAAEHRDAGTSPLPSSRDTQLEHALQEQTQLRGRIARLEAALAAHKRAAGEADGDLAQVRAREAQLQSFCSSLGHAYESKASECRALRDILIAQQDQLKQIKTEEKTARRSHKASQTEPTESASEMETVREGIECLTEDIKSRIAADMSRLVKGAQSSKTAAGEGRASGGGDGGVSVVGLVERLGELVIAMDDDRVMRLASLTARSS